MERTHRNKLRKQHHRALAETRVICLNIPDDYEFMDQALVGLLEAKMRNWLPETFAA